MTKVGNVQYLQFSDWIILECEYETIYMYYTFNWLMDCWFRNFLGHRKYFIYSFISLICSLKNDNKHGTVKWRKDIDEKSIFSHHRWMAHVYSGWEHVQQYMYSEVMEEQGNNCWKGMENWVGMTKLSHLKELQCTHSLMKYICTCIQINL
jgi:hypothetical protein